MNLSKKHKEQTKELTDNICKKSKKVTIFWQSSFLAQLAVPITDQRSTILWKESVYTLHVYDRRGAIKHHEWHMRSIIIDSSQLISLCSRGDMSASHSLWDQGSSIRIEEYPVLPYNIRHSHILRIYSWSYQFHDRIVWRKVFWCRL